MYTMNFVIRKQARARSRSVYLREGRGSSKRRKATCSHESVLVQYMRS